MRILVTGTSATGKSTLAGALRANGYTAIDIDGETNIAGSENINTHNIETVPQPRPHDWFFNHRWVWQGDKLQTYLKKFRSSETLLLFGNSENQADYYSLFDIIFVLTVEKSALEHRLLTRTNNDYGKLPHEFAASMAHYNIFLKEILAAGATAIDNTRPLEEVADEIARLVDEIIERDRPS